MNKIKKVVCLATLPCLAASSVLAAPAASLAHRYPTPTGRIVYHMTGGGPTAMNVDVATTWTNYGQKFRQDSTMHMSMPTPTKSGRMQTKPMTMKSWTIYDGNYIYSSIPNQNKVLRISMSPQQAAQMAKSIPGMDELKRMGVNSSGSFGKVVGHGVVLGRPTVIRSIATNSQQMSMSAKMWMWQSLPLRMDMKMKFKQMPTTAGKARGAARSFKMPDTTMSMVATSLDLTTKPLPSLFVLPKGVVVQDMKDFQKQFKGMMGGPRSR